MKYSVLLVDDEEEVTQAIKRKLNWEEMGFEEPRYAKNGLEALEVLAGLCHVALLVVDIGERALHDRT